MTRRKSSSELGACKGKPVTGFSKVKKLPA
jgi:hypothetical protein